MSRPTYRERVKRAEVARQRAQDAVYRAAPNLQTKFQDCLALASPDVRRAWEEAMETLSTAQAEAIAAGKAWRGTHGAFFWYVNAGRRQR